jgi:hypothetical protein
VCIHIDPHAVPVLEPIIVLSASVSKALGKSFVLIALPPFRAFKKALA